jgi:hypothetical protein
MEKLDTFEQKRCDCVVELDESINDCMNKREIVREAMVEVSC